MKIIDTRSDKSFLPDIPCHMWLLVSLVDIKSSPLLFWIMVSSILAFIISELSFVAMSSSTLDENMDADALNSRPSLSKARSSSKWLSLLSLST